MMNELSDEVLIAAIKLASKKATDEKVYIETDGNLIFGDEEEVLRDLRLILEHLQLAESHSQPIEGYPLEWEPCDWDEVKEQDKQVLIIYGTGTKISGKPSRASRYWIEFEEKVVAKRDSNAEVYRVPLADPSPNPANYPIILVTETRTNKGSIEYLSRPFAWDGDQHYTSLSGPLKAHLPHEITEWQPAEVVAKG